MASRTSAVPRAVRLLAVTAALAVAASACGGAPSAAEERGVDAVTGELTGEFRLGYLPNVTHAPGILAIADGHVAEAFGDEVAVTANAFRAGPEAITALLSGAIDAAYIGPNPAINGFHQSDGEALRIVAGATSGGAYLIT